MKIEFDVVKKMLEDAQAESHKPVSDTSLMMDYGDKMFNFGVDRMFHKTLMKLYEAEKIAKGVSE